MVPLAMLNYKKVMTCSNVSLTRATELGLMFTDFSSRNHSNVRIDGEDVVSYTNCSYLGFDTDPAMVEAAISTLRSFGLHYCCARSRLSIAPLTELEVQLSRLFGAPAITFPSLTATHAAVLPLIASGTILMPNAVGRLAQGVHLVYDRFAHASMQVLRDQLARTATVATIEHNDLGQLCAEIEKAARMNQSCVYLADGIYSMGGHAPINELLELMATTGLYLYLDDAHGTSVYGEFGEGFIVSRVRSRQKPSDCGSWPERLFVNFSLAKGFGCNGGGILVPSRTVESAVRRCAPNYLFSGPLDFAMTGAALKCIDYHWDGTVRNRQVTLRERVALFDREWHGADSLRFSPIRMIHVGSDAKAIDMAARLLARGHYVPAAFFPVVPRGEAQLRICITVHHTQAQIRKLCTDLLEIFGNRTRREVEPSAGLT